MVQNNLSLSSLTYPKTDPFLWSHIALIAGVPLSLVLCMMGLATGNPMLPDWLEILVIGLPPIAFPIWLQWRKPLSPFSLWVAARPAQFLSDEQRQVLTLLKSNSNGWIAVVAGTFIYVLFRQIYETAPLAASLTPFPQAFRLFGILWAIAFLTISSLLWQAGIAATRALLVSPSELAQTIPYPIEQINSDFTILGQRSPKLLEFSRSELSRSQVSPETIASTVASQRATTLKLETQIEPSAELLAEFQDQLANSIIPKEELTAAEEAEFISDLQVPKTEDLADAIASTTPVGTELESAASAESEPYNQEPIFPLPPESAESLDAAVNAAIAPEPDPDTTPVATDEEETHNLPE